MTRNEFAAKLYDLIETVAKSIDPNVNIIAHQIDKINVTYDAYTIRLPDKSLAPSIYPDRIIDDYFNDTLDDMLELPDDFVNQFSEQLKDMLSNMSDEIEQKIKDMLINPSNFDDVKDMIYPILISINNNQTKLNTTPYIPLVDDLAITFKIIAHNSIDSTMTCDIDNKMLTVWSKTIDEINKVALQNIKKPKFAQAFPIMAMLLGTPYISDDTFNEHFHPDLIKISNGMFVVSNRYDKYGASMILYKDLMEKICNDLNVHELYIIPASVHEVIVAPIKTNVTFEEQKEYEKFMKQMVTDVNDHEVPLEEQLSNNIYIYDGNSLQTIN